MTTIVKLVALAACLAANVSNSDAFEGRIDIAVTQGNETTSLVYSVSEAFLRIEVIGTNSPNPINIVDWKTGVVTLLFPHNRTFVKVKPAVAEVADRGQTKINEPPSATMPTPHPGIGPQPSSSSYGAPGSAPSPGVPTMPVMPPMPVMGEKIELRPTGKKEKILGFPCQQFELKARGDWMEIWATDKLVSFQPYVRNHPPRFGPRMIEEQWGELLITKKLFPLRVILHDENPTERFRFEVKTITPEKIVDKDGKLFHPPEGYTEIQPLPFGS